jgi:predicted nucleotidyltransferase
MPVRSLSSSVLKWPDDETVDQALRRWAEKLARDREDILKIGYFGSYARGDWGVGSDLDLIIILERCDQPFVRRSSEWDTAELPVPADVLVYSGEEWQSLSQQRRFYRTVTREAVWVYVKHVE